MPGADWLGVACTIVSIWLMGRKHLAGPLIAVLGSIAWLVYAAQQEAMSLALVNAVIGALSIRTAYLWYKER